MCILTILYNATYARKLGHVCRYSKGFDLIIIPYLLCTTVTVSNYGASVTLCLTIKSVYESPILTDLKLVWLLGAQELWSYYWTIIKLKEHDSSGEFRSRPGHIWQWNDYD